MVFVKIISTKFNHPKKSHEDSLEKKQIKTNPLWRSSQTQANIRVVKISEPEGAHFRILLEKVPIFAKNVRFLYYREANKKRHPPLKVAPMCSKAHVIKHSVLN